MPDISHEEQMAVTIWLVSIQEAELFCYFFMHTVPQENVCPKKCYNFYTIMILFQKLCRWKNTLPPKK
jgi:hypothetical protein